ncbi:MAG TPA: GAF domain-containing sensor histidine kinase [Polyangiaceae bacterium]|jgi:signal transduction histidine kinase|nr:GAF domain-containing sensor histidine kinase [Polyangiaceae bacterium]
MSDDEVPLSLVLGSLTRRASVEDRPLEEVIATILETSAESLRVARVNVWLYDKSRSAIDCLDGYDARTKKHALEASLRSVDYPSYFEALEELRSVTTMYATHDVRTRELALDYLSVHGISAMLDVPIVSGGQVIGVICHEHVGPAREFTAIERAFAGSIGDLVALVLETSRRIRADAEQKKLEQQLARQSALNSLGLLAAGTAHDFHDLLSEIWKNAAEIKEQVSAGPVAEAANAISKAARQAQALCEHLLTYSGQSTSSKRELDLEPVVLDAVERVRSRAPRNVTISSSCSSKLPKIFGNAPELRQALSNLISNAVDACSERGGRVNVQVDTKARQIGSEAFDFRAGETNGVWIDVSDTGIVLDEVARQRLFEPFRPTTANSSGLGLALVVGIVRSHSGLVEARSGGAAGTVVTLFLPAVT